MHAAPTSSSPFLHVGTAEGIHCLEKDKLEAFAMSFSDSSLLGHLNGGGIDVTAVSLRLGRKFGTEFLAEVNGNPLRRSKDSCPVSVSFTNMLWFLSKQWYN